MIHNDGLQKIVLQKIYFKVINSFDSAKWYKRTEQTEVKKFFSRG